jgi:hypothetical protein
VWVDDTPIAVEGDPVPSLPGQFWVFGSRPGITAGGTPYWSGGFTATPGGTTQNRGVFYGQSATVVFMGGQILPNLPFAISNGNTSFDYRFSAQGTHYIAPVQIASGSTATDEVVVLDGLGLLLDGALVREASPIPAAIGGLPAENWGAMGLFGINEAGDYFFTNNSSAATTTDEIVVRNGQIVYREGGMVHGAQLAGAIEGGYMNEQGDVAVTWDLEGGTADPEALIVNRRIVLREGDLVDLDGDGAVESNSVLIDFNGISALTMGPRGPSNFTALYFTADIDVNGTPSTLDDITGGFRMVVQVRVPGDLNCDGAVNFFDIDPFLLALFDPAQYAIDFPNCTTDNADTDDSGTVNFFDIDPFLECLFTDCW